MINYGAVRSGKTFVDNFLFLEDVRHAAQLAKREGVLIPRYILAGTRSNTIQTNILDEIVNTFGWKFPRDNHGNLYVQFPGLPKVKVVQSYDQTISGVGNIRGGTAYGAYVNEAILANPYVFHEIVRRCSAPGSHIICDTNPGIPTSWLRLEYILPARKKKSIVVNHFTFKDNKENLDPKYYRMMIETTPSGMWYQRSILGNFVAGNGIIYKDFDKNNQIESSKVPPLRNMDIFGGVDFGYNHYQSFTVLGEDRNGNIYLLEEHTRRLKTINYWIQTAHHLQDKYGNIKFVCDTNDPEDIENLRKAGINAVYADKHPGSVIAGIKVISKLMKTNRFKRVKNESVLSNKESANDPHQDNFMNEIYQYIWDTNSSRDKPVKKHDHVLDSIRYPIYLRYEHKKDKQYRPSMANQETDLRNLGLI